MFKCVNCMLMLSFIVFSCVLFADEVYKSPPKRISEIIVSPPTPILSLSPAGGYALVIDYRTQLTMEELAKPFLRLAGIRFHADTNSTRRTSFITAVKSLSLNNGKLTDIQLDPDSKYGQPTWSPDGKKIAISKITDSAIEVWVYDPFEGTGDMLTDFPVNNILMPAYQWDRDSKHLFIPSVPDNRKEPPEKAETPSGPFVQESSGRISKLRTYQDLIQTDFDEKLFAYYAQSEIKKINIETKEIIKLGNPDYYSSLTVSPDRKYILVQKLKRPFSKIVPAELFAHSWEIFDSTGVSLKTIADLPAAEQLPIQGVITGPRGLEWQQLASSTLIWVEALDGGDPNNKADFRDRILKISEPFTDSPAELLKLPQRYAGLTWLDISSKMLVSDYDRDTQWIRTWLLDVNQPQSASDAPLIFSRAVNDDYGDPGNPVMKSLPDGQEVAIASGNSLFMAGRGATPSGFRPFLNQFDLSDKTVKQLFRAATDTFEIFEGFADEKRNAIITKRESPALSPNYYLRPLKENIFENPVAVTHFPDPAQELTKIRKELLTYKRSDGIPLSGTLYYPVDYVENTKVPVVVWAYPLEYTSPKTAGQVRTTSNRFTKPEGDSILFLLLHGYAVLYRAEIPVVGDPKTANDTFIEQITDGAKAAVDKLIEKGIADPERIGVSGHSYGAFMTANLLAHTNLFAAGVARSGAYNRTLTPFGFQGERRSFWEATDVYTRLSPFTHANKINEPLLLIHGEMDDNSGTFPMQSERLFSAVQGHGGTVRLVVLPYESHGYSARESNLHVVAETIEWFDKYLVKKK
ncbi:MAG: S9 family peptidase [Candidatus Riflebacteria bacterium]|nr:S9 family peptidase [Candidatus Riflebacteria bacterium]